jgi:hypothetical protein
MDINNINETQRWMQDRLPGFPAAPTQLGHYNDSHPVVQENMKARRGIIMGTERTSNSGWSPLDSTMADLLARSTVPAEHLRSLRGHGLWQRDEVGGNTLASYSIGQGISTFRRPEEYSPDRRDWVNSTNPKDTLSGKVAVMAHELGHVQQFTTRDNPRLEASHDAQHPYIEGYAEGYAQHHTPKQLIELPEQKGGSFIKRYDGLYQISQFADKGEHAADLFMAAKQHAHDTGSPGSIKAVDDAYELGDVLTGERPDGKVLEAEKRDATHRILINQIQRESGVEQGDRDYENEVEQRNIAVHGQTIQGSMFPNIVPETNQFGSAPLLGPAEVNRSRIGRNKAQDAKTRVNKTFGNLKDFMDENRNQ